MLKVLVSIVGLTVLPIIYTVVVSSSGDTSSLSTSYHKAPAPLLAAGVPAFIALGGAGALGVLVRRSFKRSRQSTVRDDRTVA